MSHAALCLLAVAILVACTRNGPPNSLFESAGYHIRDGKVYYLNAFPGKAFEIDDADAATFKALDSTYGRDESHVFINGLPLPDADVATFELLDRPGCREGPRTRLPTRPRDQRRPCALRTTRRRARQGQSRRLLERRVGALRGPDALRHRLHRRPLPVHQGRPDRARQRQPHPRSRSLDIPSPARGLRPRPPIRLLLRPTDRRGGSVVVRPLDGPYASDSARVYWMGKAIDGADPSTFRVLNANFECSTDDQRAYYRQTVIASADPRTFPPDKAVTNCSETSISFAE